MQLNQTRTPEPPLNFNSGRDNPPRDVVCGLIPFALQRGLHNRRLDVVSPVARSLSNGASHATGPAASSSAADDGPHHWLTELFREREHTAEAVLVLAGFNPQATVFEVDVAPLTREQFGLHTPTGDVRNAENRRQIGRQVFQECLQLIGFEKAFARVVFVEHADYGTLTTRPARCASRNARFRAAISRLMVASHISSACGSWCRGRQGGRRGRVREEQGIGQPGSNSRADFKHSRTVHAK
jgi:hypothetical protein